MQQWRNRRGLEADAARKIDEARALVAEAAVPQPITIETESIESDEAVHEQFKWTVKGILGKLGIGK